MKSPRLLGAAVLFSAMATVQAGELAAELDWSGRVTLAMPVSGVVEAVMASPGQHVKKGELLATLNPILFKAGVAEAKADADRMTAELADAQRDLDRVKELYARTVSATTELDAAQLRFDRSSSAMAGAHARLEKARHQLEQSELRAPFDAIVLERIAEPGLVAATPCQPNPLFSLARSDELVASAPASATQAASLAPGQKVEVSIAGKTVRGEIRGISLRADGKRRLDVAVPQSKGLLPGQAATIRLP